jgi:hypothetical protein
MVMPPTRTNSNFPFSNTRTSSGFSNRFKISSYIKASNTKGHNRSRGPLNPYRRRPGGCPAGVARCAEAGKMPALLD